MMGLKFLFNPNDRIVLWRNTIQLFHESKKTKYVGPFKAAGFKYAIEKMCASSDENKYPTPDIIASSSNGVVVLELTTDSHKSKKYQLKKYESISSEHLHIHGLKKHHNKQPDVLSSRLQYLNDGNYCQLIVQKNLEIKKIECIQNQELSKKLKDSEGIDLSKVPAIPITIVPEMHNKPNELLRGLVEIIMQIFNPTCEGKTAAEIVEDGMERLYLKVDPSTIKKLNDKVVKEMDLLVKDQLKEYLTKKDAKYVATDRFKVHFKTMGSINLILKKWAGLSTQSTMNDF